MGDMGDIFNAMREHKREAKVQRIIDQAPFVEWLRGQSVTWRELPGGYRFNIANAQGHQTTFDYWPGRGKWCQLAPGRAQKYQQGERRLSAAVTKITGKTFDAHA